MTRNENFNADFLKAPTSNFTGLWWRHEHILEVNLLLSWFAWSRIHFYRYFSLQHPFFFIHAIFLGKICIVSFLIIGLFESMILAKFKKFHFVLLEFFFEMECSSKIQKLVGRSIFYYGRNLAFMKLLFALLSWIFIFGPQISPCKIGFSEI